MNDLIRVMEMMGSHPFGPEPIVISRDDDGWTVQSMSSFEDLRQDGVHAYGTGKTPQEALEDFIDSLRADLAQDDD